MKSVGGADVRVAAMPSPVPVGEAVSESAQDVRDVLRRALMPTGLTRASIPTWTESEGLVHVQVVVEALLHGLLRSPELDLTELDSLGGYDCSEVRVLLPAMAQEGWAALQQESVARSGHGITSVRLGEIISQNDRIATALSLLPSLEHVHLAVPSTYNDPELDFGRLQLQREGQPPEFHIEGDSDELVLVKVPSGAKVTPSIGLRCLVQEFADDGSISATRLVMRSAPDLPPEILQPITSFLSLKDQLVFATTAKHAKDIVDSPAVKALRDAQDGASDTVESYRAISRAEANLKYEDELRNEAAELRAKFNASPRTAWLDAAVFLQKKLGRPQEAERLLQSAIRTLKGAPQWAAMACMAQLWLQGPKPESGLGLTQQLDARIPSREEMEEHKDVFGSVLSMRWKNAPWHVLALALTGNLEDARHSLQRVVAHHKHSDKHFCSAIISWLEQEDPEEPEEAIRRLRQTSGGPMREAWFRAWTQDRDASFAILEREKANWGSRDMMNFANSHFADRLRDDARWLPLLQYYNLDPAHLATIPFDVEFPSS